MGRDAGTRPENKPWGRQSVSKAEGEPTKQGGMMRSQQPQHFPVFPGQSQPASALTAGTVTCLFVFIFKILLICLSERDREGESEQAGEETGRWRSSVPTEQGSRCGARSPDPEIMTQREGRRFTDWATRRLVTCLLSPSSVPRTSFVPGTYLELRYFSLNE